MQRTGIEILKNCGEKNWKFFVEKFNFKKKLEKQTGKTYWKNLLEKLTGITNWKFSTQIVEIKSILNLL